MLRGIAKATPGQTRRYLAPPREGAKPDRSSAEAQAKRTNFTVATDIRIPAKGPLSRAYHRAFNMGALKPHAKSLLPYFNRPGGRFVEIGARDGIKESLTPYLEKALGWKGILIEPWPHLFHRCRKNRKASVCLNVAAVNRQLRDSCIEIAGLPPGTSIRQRLAQEARERTEGKPVEAPIPGKAKPKHVSYVSTNSLKGILERANFEHSFELLTLNLPGYEAEVLEGMDFETYKPTFLLIRASTGDVKLPRLPSYYQRIVASQHDTVSTLHLFRYSDFGAN